jgi:hypothetical protein
MVSLQRLGLEMQTLLLNPQTWDLVVDASNNIAVAGNPYSLAQDAASAIKLFLGELYFDTTQGVPYFQQILGKLPNVSLLKAKLAAAALTVPGVVSATVFITSIVNRQVSGQVQVTDQNGNVTAANF